jgi:hypothetical protein
MTFEEARRKAKYSHKDWINWRDKNGVQQYARMTVETVKAAMLATGTKGYWTVIGASTGICYRTGWRVGVNILANLKGGYI